MAINLHAFADSMVDEGGSWNLLGSGSQRLQNCFVTPTNDARYVCCTKFSPTPDTSKRIMPLVGSNPTS